MTFYRVSRSFPSVLGLLTVKALAVRVTKINVNDVVSWKNRPDGMLFHNGLIRKESARQATSCPTHLKVHQSRPD